jgi:hypothetical protein
MKKAALQATLLVCVALLSSCASRDHRLEGSWKSNKQLTVATIHFRKPVPKSKRARLENIFGKLVVKYDRTHLAAELPPTNGYPLWQFRSRYRIVASDEDSLACISVNPITGKKEISHIHFEGPDRYWEYLGGSGWKEYFDRLKPQKNKN